SNHADSGARRTITAVSAPAPTKQGANWLIASQVILRVRDTPATRSCRYIVSPAADMLRSATNDHNTTTPLISAKGRGNSIGCTKPASRAKRAENATGKAR